ncbi:MAG: multicopper oxidase domain-containing protein [Cryobacterium sp.]|nr:multicopper oxidase domain-containing protein [Cryobacterium sp.]
MNRRRWYLVMNSIVAFWLVLAAIAVMSHRFIPQGSWLMVHLLLLGAVSTAILIWSQHFADTLLRRPAPGGRAFHGVRLFGHTAGALTVVIGMILGFWPLVLAGGIVIALVMIAHIAVLIIQSRGSLPARFAPLVRYYIAAPIALAIGVGLGVYMSSAGITDAVHDRIYPAHLAFNLLGWVGLTVVGTLVILWPTVLHARVSDKVDWIGRTALWLCVAGLAVIGAATLADFRPLFAIGILVYLIGAVLIAVDGAKVAGKSKQWNFASWSLIAAYFWFLFCTVAFGIVVAVAPTWSAMDANLAQLIGPFAVGFAAQVLFGALGYLLPVVLGGGPEQSRRTIAILEKGSLYRVAVVNLGIALYLLPVPSYVKVVDALLVFVILLVFVFLAIRAAVVSRKPVEAEAKSAAKKAAAGDGATLIARRGGALAAAVSTVVLALTIGIVMDPVAAGLNLTPAAPTVQATGHTTVVEVTMKDMRFHPAVVEVPAGDKLVLKVTNKDDQVHDLVLEDGATSGLLNPTESSDVTVKIVSSDLDGWCSIAGHKLLGMVMKVKIIGGPTLAPTASPGDHGDHIGSEATGPSAAEDLDLSKEPASSFVARDPSLAPAPAETVHSYTFTVGDTNTEVAPGVSQDLWTYNGTAPGPTLRGKVGDKFVITLVNDGTIGHSIDFHAGSLAPDEPMKTIQPGEQLTYTFTATKSGIWLYHCSTAPMSMHIANGMFGAVIIDPPGLPEVDQEFLLVQSEYYLGPQGGVADVTRIATQNPDLVTFNGYADQYMHRPIKVTAGERVRIWVLDAGPNRPSSFHVVGGQFDTVFSEGDYLLKVGGSTGTGGAQALSLQPAQGGFVEMTFPEAGNYSFVTHIMSDAEKGAMGIFQVAPQAH